MSITAMRQALEFIEETNKSSSFWMVPASRLNQTAYALRKAIAEAEKQEPVAYAVYHRFGGGKSLHWPEQHSEHGDAEQYELVPLYPQPKQPLTDFMIEMSKVLDNYNERNIFIDGWLSAEAAHGIKGEA